MTALDQFTLVAVAAVNGAGFGTLLVLMVQKNRAIAAQERENHARRQRMGAAFASLAEAYADLAADLDPGPKP